MADALTLNGLALEIRDETLQVDYQEIGASGRSESGAAYSSVVAVKNMWKFSTPPIAKATASAWIGWLNGAIHFPFDSDESSTDGLPQASDPGNLALLDAAQKKFGAKSEQVQAGGAPTWKIRCGSTWGLRCHARQSGTWYHYVVNSDSTVYKDSVSQGGGIPAWMSLTSGVLTLRDFSGADTWYDDVVIIGACVPSSWITADAGPWSFSGAATYPTVPPKLILGGQACQASASVIGRVTAAKTHYIGSAWYQSLDVELLEV